MPYVSNWVLAFIWVITVILSLNPARSSCWRETHTVQNIYLKEKDCRTCSNYLKKKHTLIQRRFLLVSRWPVCLTTAALCSLLSSWLFGVGADYSWFMMYSSDVEASCCFTTQLCLMPNFLKIYIYDSVSPQATRTPNRLISQQWKHRRQVNE